MRRLDRIDPRSVGRSANQRSFGVVQCNGGLTSARRQDVDPHRSPSHGRARASHEARIAAREVVRCPRWGRSDRVGGSSSPGCNAEMETLPLASCDTEMPARLGRYRVVAPLGRGGSGVVYRAIGPDGAEVAIKTVGRSTHALAGLRAEILAVRRGQHRGIVRVLDDGVTAGCPWFAMELLAGETLADHARRLRAARGDAAWSPAQPRPVLHLGADPCQPLARLHEVGIVHHDLKPENIMLGEGRVPIIVDLGLARRGRTEPRATAEHASLGGTLAYMAPEQLTGELLDARADLYALGCILVELLVGEPPARGVRIAPSRLVGGSPTR